MFIQVVFAYGWSEKYWYVIEREVEIGDVIRCGFGTNKSELTGVVFDICTTEPDNVAIDKLKIAEFVRQYFSLIHIQYFDALAAYYYVRIGEVLKTCWSKQFIEFDPIQALSLGQKKTCKTLESIEHINLESIELESIEQINLVSIKRTNAKHQAIKLTTDQLKAIDTLRTQQFAILTGATGSGKTHVFLQALVKHGQRLILVPEILLTSALFENYKHYITSNVFIWHCGVSKTVKQRIYRRIINGDDITIIATRSGVLLPFTNLTHIIIDEAHDQSYKQTNDLRYYAYTCAKILMQLHNCKLLLVTATPKLEHVYDSAQLHTVEMKKLQMNDESSDVKYPLTIVTLTRLPIHGQSTIMTVDTKQEYGPIAKTTLEMIKQHKHTLLFLNKKGYARHVSCNECNKKIMCHGCGVYMYYYKKVNRVMCYVCGYNYQLPIMCCSKPWILSGLGIEKVEEIIQKLLPHHSCVTISSDLGKVKRKQVFDNLEQNNIIIGTQILAQGHHLPQLSLVVVLDTDTILMHPAYDVTERALSLIKQLRGRCGRGNIPGIIVLQTYFPDNQIFKALQDPQIEQELLKQQLIDRERFYWPPFCKLVSVILESKDLVKLKQQIHALCKELKDTVVIMNDRSIVILGPVPLQKKKFVYQYRLIIKYKIGIESLLMIAKRYKATIDVDAML